MKLLFPRRENVLVSTGLLLLLFVGPQQSMIRYCQGFTATKALFSSTRQFLLWRSATGGSVSSSFLKQGRQTLHQRHFASSLKSEGGGAATETQEASAQESSPKQQSAQQKSRNIMSSSQQKALLGGDFAGYTAQYNVQTGQILDVPMHLVPPSLSEWGQHPTSLEGLVSEDAVDKEESSSSSSLRWNRVCLTILPETGCAIDNLEVQKTVESNWKSLSSSSAASSSNAVALARRVPNKSNKEKKKVVALESIFALDENEEEDCHRLRVTAIILLNDSSSPSLLQNLAVAYERRFDASSSAGTRANGGGLDGASVAKWMGPHVFRDGPKLLLPDGGTEPSTTTKITEESLKDSSSSSHVVNLAANITVAFTTNDQGAQLAVSHASSGQGLQYQWSTTITENDDDDDDWIDSITVAAL